MIAPASDLVTPAVYRCRLTHTRRVGLQRAFTHTVHLWLVDVDELPHLPRPFSGIVRFDPRDHLGQQDHTLRTNLDAFLAANGITLTGGRILMLAQPRGLGYAFDPVSFFFCYRADGSPAHVITEVRNTFGERHAYLSAVDTTTSVEVAKQLYVSPYCPADGSYLMHFALDSRRLTISITLFLPNGKPAVGAVLTGSPLDAPTSLTASTLFPGRVFSAIRTIVLIHWHAWWLRLRGQPRMRFRGHQPQPGVDAPAGIAGKAQP